MPNPITSGVAGNDFHVDANHSNFIGSPVDIGNSDAHGGGGFFGSGGPVTSGVAGNEFDVHADHANFIGSALDIGNSDASHFHF